MLARNLELLLPMAMSAAETETDWLVILRTASEVIDRLLIIENRDDFSCILREEAVLAASSLNNHRSKCHAVWQRMKGLA